MAWYRLIIHSNNGSETYWVQDDDPPVDPKRREEFEQDLIRETADREAPWTRSAERWSADIEEMTPPLALIEARLASAKRKVRWAEQTVDDLQHELLRVSKIPGAAKSMVQDWRCYQKCPQFTAIVKFQAPDHPTCPACGGPVYHTGPQRPDGYVEKEDKT